MYGHTQDSFLGTQPVCQGKSGLENLLFELKFKAVLLRDTTYLEYKNILNTYNVILLIIGIFLSFL